jgi:hypothetical protein
MQAPISLAEGVDDDLDDYRAGDQAVDVSNGGVRIGLT